MTDSQAGAASRRETDLGRPDRRAPGAGPARGSGAADPRPSPTGDPRSAENRLRSSRGLPCDSRYLKTPGAFSPKLDGGDGRERRDNDRVQDLLEAKRRFGLALRAAGAGAWEWNIDTNQTIWSEENYAVMGLPPGDGRATYEEWFACVHPDDRDYATKQVETAVRQKTDLDFEYRAVWPDGSTHWIRDVGKIMLDEDGAAIGMFGIQMDVTENRVLQDQRARLLRDLERRNAELEELAYTLSHELRSPLVTIGGFLSCARQSAARGDLEAVISDLDRIQDAQTRMARLLSDQLRLCRLSLASVPAEEAPFAEVVREAAAASGDVLREAGLRLGLAEELPIVRGDKARLVEAMRHLLENAARFTRHEARPRVEIGTRSDRGRPVVFVRDNGIGIAPAFREKVFEPFRKLDPTGPGTGAGLALVQRIIEVHGGRIWVESPGVGHGATFCILLPWVDPRPGS